MAGHIQERRWCQNCNTPFKKSKQTKQFTSKCPNCSGGSFKKLYCARYPDPNSPRPTAQIEKSFHTKRDAEDWLHSQRAAVLTGTHIAPSKAERRFSDLIEAWKESWASRELGPQTTARYEQVLRTYIDPKDSKRVGLAHRKVNTLTHEALQRWFDNLRKQGTSTWTLRKIHTVLSAIFRKAVKVGSVAANPCYSIELPPIPQRDMVILDTDEIATLAEKIDTHWQLPVYVAAYTGLRAGEQWALTRKDLDFLRGSIAIHKAMKLVPELSIGPTKTHQRRTITPGDKIMKMLEAYVAASSGGTGPWPAVRKSQGSWQLYWTEDWQNPDRLVFTTPSGTPVRHNLFHKRHFKKAVKALFPRRPDEDEAEWLARLPRWHDLRHTHASLLIRHGANIVLVSKRLGHKSTQMTLDTYAHLYPSEEVALASALDSVFTTEAKPDNVRALRS